MKFRKSSLLSKILILAVAVYALCTLASLHQQTKEKLAQADALTAQLTQAEQENRQLQQDIANKDTDEGTKDIARSKLGMVEDGEIIFNDVGN